MSSLVAATYAESLFEAACDDGCEKELLDEIDALEQIILLNPDFVRLLCVPNIEKSEKHTLIDNIFKGKTHIYLVNFLKLLVDKGRVSSLSEIIREYRKCYRKKYRITKAEVITVTPLSDRLKQKLTEKLEKITGMKVELDLKVNPEIIGGMVINMDYRQFDASVKTQLHQLRDFIGAAKPQ